MAGTFDFGRAVHDKKEVAVAAGLGRKKKKRKNKLRDLKNTPQVQSVFLLMINLRIENI